MSMRYWFLALGLSSSLAQGAEARGNQFGVQKQFWVGGRGGWDYLTVDPRTHDLLGNGVLLVSDAVSGRHVAEVPVGKGPDAAVLDHTFTVLVVGH